jgi:replicative DNA helicase
MRRHAAAMPADPEAECATLAALLFGDAQTAAKVEAILAPADFTDPIGRVAYESLLAFAHRGERADAALLKAEMLQRECPLSPADIQSWIMNSLGEGIPAFAERYARIVAQKARLREQLELAEDLWAAGLAPDADPDAVQGMAEERLLALSRRGTGGGRDRSIMAALHEVMDWLDSPSTGIWSGIDDLDYLLNGGLKPGRMTLLGAREEHGKTSLALQWARLAARNGHSVLIASLEMGRSDLTTRMVCQGARINSAAVEDKILTPPQREQFAREMERLARLPIEIAEDIDVRSVQALARHARQQKLAGKLDLLVVDSLQELKSEGRHNGLREEMVAVTIGLKALAKSLNIHALVITRVNRDAARGRRDDRSEPTNAMLAETDVQGFEADTVLLLHRPDPTGTDVDLIVTKNRNGRKGRVALAFDGPTTTFSPRPTGG